jgi:hypothetical protein
MHFCAFLRVFARNKETNRRCALIRMLSRCVNLGADGKMCVVGLHRKRCTPTTPVLTRAFRSTASCSARLTAAAAAPK